MRTLKTLTLTSFALLLLLAAGTASAQVPDALLVVETIGATSFSGPVGPPILIRFESTATLYRDQWIFAVSRTDSAAGTLVSRVQAQRENLNTLYAALAAGRIGQRNGACLLPTNPEGDEGGIESLTITWFGKNERRSRLQLVTTQPDVTPPAACSGEVLSLLEAISTYQASVDPEHTQTVSTGTF